MKLMFCIGSLAQGGAERVVANLSNEMIKKYDVSIVATITDKPFYSIDERIKYYTLDNDSERKGLLARTFNRIKRLRQLLKQERPDVVVAFLPEPTFRVLIAKAFLNIKTIVSVRNDPNVLYNTFMKKMIVKLLYPSSDGFVFQTEDAKKWFAEKIQKKSTVIPNPINESFVVKPYDGKRDKSIVCVARLVKQKNHKMLIDSFSQIVSKHEDYILKIYGDGPCRTEIEKQIDDLNLKSKVILMGEVSDIKNEIYKAGLFVLPSDYEGMPNALMEAMALGLPCVSTDCPIGGPRFLIENQKSGILFKVGDKQGLIDAMNYVIDNPEKAKEFGNNANKICDRLKPSVINGKWEKYILEVSKGKKS